MYPLSRRTLTSNKIACVDGGLTGYIFHQTHKLSILFSSFDDDCWNIHFTKLDERF